MKSKSQVHRFCDLYMLNATPKNPVPTDKILRSLNNKLVAWGAKEQDLITAVFTCLHWYLTYFYNLFYFHIYLHASKKYQFQIDLPRRWTACYRYGRYKMDRNRSNHCFILSIRNLHCHAWSIFTWLRIKVWTKLYSFHWN